MVRAPGAQGANKRCWMQGGSRRWGGGGAPLQGCCRRTAIRQLNQKASLAGAGWHAQGARRWRGVRRQRLRRRQAGRRAHQDTTRGCLAAGCWPLRAWLPHCCCCCCCCRCAAPRLRRLDGTVEPSWLVRLQRGTGGRGGRDGRALLPLTFFPRPQPACAGTHTHQAELKSMWCGEHEGPAQGKVGGTHQHCWLLCAGRRPSDRTSGPAGKLSHL